MLLAVAGLVMGAPSQYYDGTGRPYPSLHTDQYTNLYNARGYGKFYGVIFDSKKLDEELYSRYCVNWFACNIHGKSSWDRVEQDIGSEKTKKFEAEKQAVHGQIASLDHQIASIEANRPDLQGEMKKRYDRATVEIGRLEGLIADKGKEDASFTGEFEAEAGRYLNDLAQDVEEQKNGSDANSQGPKEASWKGALDAAEGEGQSLASGVFGVPAAEVKYTYKTPKATEFGSRLFEAQRYHQGAEGYIKGLTSDPYKAERLGLLDYSNLYLGLADQYNASGQSRDGTLFLNAALNAIDLAIGFVPGVSLGYDLLQIGLGRNPLTGEKLSNLERGVLIGTLFVPSALSGAGKSLARLGKALKGMPDNNLAKLLVNVINESDKVAGNIINRQPCFVERSNIDKVFDLIIGATKAYACDAKNQTDVLLDAARNLGMENASDIQKALGSYGKPRRIAADPNFIAPAKSIDQYGRLTNGKYTVIPGEQARHTVGAFDATDHAGRPLPAGKSQFLYRTSADDITLDAAAYADKRNLWQDDGQGGLKAKVIFDQPVGVHNRTGSVTNVVNVYARKNGNIHGSPSSPE
ncbi:MAG TPA: pre-toxin TG domain-containing protein [Oligoflexus sp.]|nr:pre-toxin TG domain-containing protein [Oligoflexus sp.]